MQLLLKNDKKFVLSNVITHKGKTNNLLKEFIDKNKDQLKIKYIEEHKYNSFGSMRKKEVQNNTMEIIISNF